MVDRNKLIFYSQFSVLKFYRHIDLYVKGKVFHWTSPALINLVPCSLTHLL